MTTKSYTKVFKQLKSKPVKLAKVKKHNAPKLRSCGKAQGKCRRCGSSRAHIQKYGLKLCRKCFREIAKSIGFRKYS